MSNIIEFKSISSSIIKGDCIEEMNKLIDNEVMVDFILVDPPYNKTRGRWDSIIDVEEMWKCIKKIIKQDGAICIFGNEPFSSIVRTSNLDMYRYDWKWVKNRATGFANCNYRPMLRYEDIMVFSKSNASVGGKNNSMIYKPQGLIQINKTKKNVKNRHGLIHNDTNNVGNDNSLNKQTKYVQKFTNYPDNILMYNCEKKYVHPTQKPTELLKYLINTYTNENDLVLDFASGSCSTAISCIDTNRKFLMIEKDDKYFEIGKNRVENYIKEKGDKLK